MKRRTYGSGTVIAAFVVISLGAVLLVGNHPSKVSLEKNEKALQAMDWLRDYYTNYPIGGGWQITSITTRGSNVDIVIRVPDREASGIMHEPQAKQFRVTSVGCPGRHEKIWTLIDVDQTVILHVANSGGVFIDTDCRLWD